MPRLFQVADPGHHVDDRLGGEPGHGGRADVVDTALQPWSEYPLQENAFGLEATRPLGVVRNDDDRLVRHRRRLPRV